MERVYNETWGFEAFPLLKLEIKEQHVFTRHFL